MDELFEKIKTYDWGQSRAALTETSDLVRKAHASPGELSKMEKNLIEVLKSDATPAAKQFVCRELSIIGTEQSVPALAEMLTQKAASDQQPHPADMARYALERIPGAAVDEALRSALPKTSGKTKVGIINSLGQRRDRKAVSALGSLVGDSDQMVAAAAVGALGQIADTQATKVLAEAKGKATGKLRLLVLDAYLKCADRLVAEGKKAEALAIYEELRKEPKPIGIAALQGKLNAEKGKGPK